MTRSGRPRPRVVLMVRYPDPGSVKTRLAAGIGDVQAAAVHRELAEYCARRLRAVELSTAIDLEARVAGPPAGRAAHASAGLVAPPDPRSWPPRISLRRPQCDGDLGARLAEALRTAIARGAPAAIAVGSDCPGLGGRQIRAACAALEDHDVVLGPARDGGYYLIGVRATASALLPALFGDRIPWGTPAVLECTLETLRAAGAMPPVLLEALDDIDVTSDLPVWERARAAVSPTSVSVVIPAFDESESVGHAVRSALRAGADEVVVADSSADENTADAARAAGALAIRAGRGRALQMNAGAARARGDALVFLHADTTLPEGAAELVRLALSELSVSGGAFGFSAGSPDSAFDRAISSGGRIRYALSRLPYGDQAIFTRALDFEDLGGFLELPTMEDYELARRLRALGTLARPQADVCTSTRAWREHGLVRATAVNLAVIAGYRAGVDPERLAAWRDHATSRA